MLFIELKNENSDVYTQELENDIYNAIKQIVEQEKIMTEYLYKTGNNPYVSKEDSLKFIEFMANRALKLLDLNPIFSIKDNPVKFMDEILAGIEFSNFFEVEATEYSRGAVVGDINKVEKDKWFK